MKQYQCEMLATRTLAPGTVLQTYAGPEIARAARPGQFVNIRPSSGTDPLLRRPISICTVDRLAGTFALLIKEAGEGTRMLCALRPGTRVDMLAPLGVGFQWRPGGRMILVAGGVGVAPMLFLAREVRAAERAAWPEVEGNSARHESEIVFCYGARSKNDFVLLDDIRAHADRVILTTVDGSAGEQGFVTPAAERMFVPGAQIFTCGPNPMMDDLLARMRRTGLEGQVSLENQMGCGIGACQGCVVPTRQGYVRICCDGPVLTTEMLENIGF
jgi:dihydroorotate dehydrogenase electron transfer subunit